MFIKSAAC